ncbi:MAG: GAF domain-containing protein [Anaerolineales bacterium]|nr:GAF domain-containing protein [Anaerolineales bacterium]
MLSPAAATSPLALLLKLGQAFHSTLEFDPLLVSILKQVQSAVSSEGASIWLLDADGQRLKCTHAVGPEAGVVIGAQLPAAELRSSCPRIVGETLRIDAAEGDEAAQRCLPTALRQRARNAILAPLGARGDWLGVIAFTNKLEQPAFSEDDRVLVAALAGHAALAIQNAQLYERQRRSNERQQLLEQISRHMQQTLHIDSLIPLVLREVNKALDAEAQSLWLLNPQTNMLACRFATGLGAEAIKRVQVPLGQGIVGRSVARHESIISEDGQRDTRIFRAADAQTGFVTRSLLCVPLVRQGQAVGAIEAVNKHGGQSFSADDLELLRSIADSAALAIENARLFAELAASYDSTLEALAAAIDLRDRETEGHSRRVVAYTARLARQRGLSEAEIAEICRGALIHDIGKIGVPDAILLKPSALDPQERRIIQQHPQAGFEMLLGVPYLKDEIQIVLAHQERWDGSGYPFGLKGEAIPLGARLFAVADTFDALTSDRPYRRGQPMARAREIIAVEAGVKFDPDVAAAFLAVPLSEWEQIRAQVEAEVAQRRSGQRERIRQSLTAVLPLSS